MMRFIRRKELFAVAASIAVAVASCDGSADVDPTANGLKDDREDVAATSMALVYNDPGGSTTGIPVECLSHPGQQIGPIHFVTGRADYVLAKFPTSHEFNTAPIDGPSPLTPGSSFPTISCGAGVQSIKLAPVALPLSKSLGSRIVVTLKFFGERANCTSVGYPPVQVQGTGTATGNENSPLFELTRTCDLLVTMGIYSCNFTWEPQFPVCTRF